MAKFNREKVLRRLEFKRKWRSYSRYVYIAVPCVLCCLLCLYFAYSKFFVKQEIEVVRTTVGEFTTGDIVLNVYIDNEKVDAAPKKGSSYVFDQISCDNGAEGTWNSDTWSLLITKITNKNKCNVYFSTKLETVVEKVTTLAQSDTTNFASDDHDNNIRYIGADPNNYIYFNCSDYSNQSSTTCEKWRIIGLFNNITKSDGIKENLIKIIRDESLGNFYWDYKQDGVGSSTKNYGSNDWSDSQLMMMLNPVDYLKKGYTNSNDIISYNNQELYSKMGSYYNGTTGCKSASVTSGSTFRCAKIDFTSNGFKNDNTRNAIETVVWNLGGTSSYTSSSNGLANHWYGYERGTKVSTGRPTTWTGKIGLMYPSDYGYATSGGSTTSRSACLNKELYNWDDSSVSDCKNNDYLYKSSYTQWTLATFSSLNFSVFRVTEGIVHYDDASYYNGVRPVVFLKSNIPIASGTGTSSDPYQLKIS